LDAAKPFVNGIIWVYYSDSPFIRFTLYV